LSRPADERLADISEAIDRIREDVGDLESASIDSPVVADAVVYNLLVIGEAVKNLGEQARAKNPGIPWSDIAGMHDLLAHEYFRVDPRIVEQTVRRNLVDLDRTVVRLRSSP
jgi:uncharacterized protein with HEPN domain